MHDGESSRGKEEVTHLSKSHFIASEDKDVENDLLGHHSFDEGIVVVFGTCEIFDVLTST